MSGRIAALIREPALLIDAFESLVVVLIALGMFNLHGDQQTNVIAAFIALLAFTKGFLTHPFPATVVPDLGRALLVLCGSFGLLHLTADQVTLLATFLGTLMTVVQRAQISPRYDSVSRPGGSGAGPVTHEVGAVGLLNIGYVLLVVGIVLLLIGYLLVPGLIYVGWVCLVIGLIAVVVALLIGASSRRL